jgi:FkbM family methyltransferase
MSESAGTSAGTLRLEVGGLHAAIALALKQGVPVASIIDLGCADGNFSVMLRRMGRLAGADLLNIDAQALYEPSLRRIQGALGGHYRICAVAEQAGTLDLTTGAHPYWSSLRAPGDAYWQQLHGAHGATVSVPAYPLDRIVAETGLAAPHLIKLDLQGGERAALAGAPRTLAATSIVVVETMIEDFGAIHRMLADAGFELFDLTTLQRGPDHSLAWFYPVYVHRRFGARAPRTYWPIESTAQVVATQEQRRNALLRELDELLAPLEAARRDEG